MSAIVDLAQRIASKAQDGTTDICLNHEVRPAGDFAK
jgi:hypothetical protein